VSATLMKIKRKFLHYTYKKEIETKQCKIDFFFCYVYGSIINLIFDYQKLK
jgi:hypothetical protein